MQVQRYPMHVRLDLSPAQARMTQPTPSRLMPCIAFLTYVGAEAAHAQDFPSRLQALASTSKMGGGEMER